MKSKCDGKKLFKSNLASGQDLATFPNFDLGLDLTFREMNGGDTFSANTPTKLSSFSLGFVQFLLGKRALNS